MVLCRSETSWEKFSVCGNVGVEDPGGRRLVLGSDNRGEEIPTQCDNTLVSRSISQEATSILASPRSGVWAAVKSDHLHTHEEVELGAEPLETPWKTHTRRHQVYNNIYLPWRSISARFPFELDKWHPLQVPSDPDGRWMDLIGQQVGQTLQIQHGCIEIAFEAVQGVSRVKKG